MKISQIITLKFHLTSNHIQPWSKFCITQWVVNCNILECTVIQVRLGQALALLLVQQSLTNAGEDEFRLPVWQLWSRGDPHILPASAWKATATGAMHAELQEPTAKTIRCRGQSASKGLYEKPRVSDFLWGNVSAAKWKVCLFDVGWNLTTEGAEGRPSCESH